MARTVEHLDLDELLDLARRLLGDPPPIRDVGLLGAAARPQTTVLGQDAYPDLFTKAAALLQSIVKNHALVDGNKRLGWLAAAVFLEIDGIPVTHIPNDDVYDLVIDIAAHHHTVDEIADRLRRPPRQPDRAHLRGCVMRRDGATVLTRCDGTNQPQGRERATSTRIKAERV